MAEAPPSARVVRSRAALAEAVAQWPQSNFNTTWALVAVAEVPSAPELATLRQAAKTCDRVAAVVVPPQPGQAAKTLPTLPTVLRAAGCDLVWVPAAAKGLLSLQAQDGLELLPLLQAVLAVLPSVVLAPRADATRARAWRLLQSECGGVVDLRLV
ncbi:MAG: hypothetical protein INF43_01765 [Alphaproteobacteria bacterium]|nr:hypothetical protein [Alphaproteobacteria bacterium]